MTVNDRRGVLAKLAAEIASADSNIVQVHMGDANASADQQYVAIQFTLEVRHRMHLASVLRQLRHMPEVVRITRVKSGTSRDNKTKTE